MGSLGHPGTSAMENRSEQSDLVSAAIASFTNILLSPQVFPCTRPHGQFWKGTAQFVAVNGSGQTYAFLWKREEG